ncbi:hypothetical protein [Plantibacter sp. VKM Ac-2880]|uniref:DUF6993 domain-containing protein n=1 Tax=Plantibacter sp. VKM Ac-2880 TaxID=2783827 RepID=UPI00351C0034
MQKSPRDRPASVVSPVRRRSSSVGLGLVVVLGALGLGLTGCAQPAPVPTPTATQAPTPTETPAAAPVLQPEGTAADNLPFFDTVNAATLAANPAAGGQAIIDGLVAAGFPKAEMEVSSDTTSIGEPADSIQFSIRWQGQCILGQNGPATGYHSSVVPLLDTGRCLIGATRPIDW